MNERLSLIGQYPDISNRPINTLDMSCEKTRRITLIISKLGPGGADRAMTAMANYWAAHGEHVTLITLALPHGDFYVVDERVRRVGLGLMSSADTPRRPLRDNLKRLKHLRREIRLSRPDVVISFNAQQNVLTILASLRLGVPVIVCEQIDPRRDSIGRPWEALRRLVYPQATAVVVVAAALCEWAQQVVRKNKVYFVPNPMAVALNGSSDADSRRNSKHVVAAMGRLTHQKGFDLLLQAFSRCVKNHSDWSLVILGEGEDRKRLESLAVELGIETCVDFPGVVSNPERILRAADLFVMSSRYEGFPLALLEAMACGLAVICTDCPTGPGEIISNGADGVLVPAEDVDALTGAIDCLMSDQKERERLGARAAEVTERFGLERVMNRWNDVLTDACKVAR
jgi:GalNAc-alpha-(1->4)-GalNAc-alpha-(1->3)-diNAcBac-PP-undecaprenol alpha-1,4-N-acetyl-D-galactosaminyltransferase